MHRVALPWTVEAVGLCPHSGGSETLSQLVVSGTTPRKKTRRHVFSPICPGPPTIGHVFQATEHELNSVSTFRPKKILHDATSFFRIHYGHYIAKRGVFMVINKVT